MDSLLGSLEEITGKLTKRRVERLADSPENLQKIVKPLVEAASTAGAVPRKPNTGRVGGHLRPYIPAPSVRTGQLLQGKFSTNAVETERAARLYSREFSDLYTGQLASPEQFDRIAQFLGQRLLYAHSIAIDDPLTTFALKIKEDVISRKREARPAGLLPILHFLAAVRPLITSGSLILVPAEPNWYSDWLRKPGAYAEGGVAEMLDWAAGRPEPEPYLEFNWSVFKDHDDRFKSGSMRRYLADADREWARNPIVAALEEMTPRVARYVRYVDRIDFEVPDRFCRIALDEFMAQLSQDSDQNGDRHLDRIRQNSLASLPLPSLASIGVQDLVRLHEDPEFFGVWRLALARALDRIYTDVSPGSDEYAQSAKRIVGEELTTALDIWHGRNASSVPLLEGGIQQVAYGSITAAAATISQSLPVGLAAAAAVGAVHMAWTFASGKLRRGRSSDGTLRDAVARLAE